MIRSNDIIFYCVFISCICYQLSVIHGATSTTKFPPVTSKSNGTKTPGRGSAKTGGKIITLRLGSDGSTPEEQCECRLFYLCEKDNTVDTSQNAQSCEENYVCCRIDPVTEEDVILSSTNSPSTSGSASTSGQIGSIATQNPDTCRCVPADQCQRTREEQESGVGGIDQRKTTCGVTEWCCSPENIITGGGISPSTRPVPVDTSPTPPDLSPDCGMRNTGQKVFNRILSPSHLRNTSFGEFPWMALLLSAEIDSTTGNRVDNIFVCGASLLSSKIVLTASHCVQDIPNVSLLKVRVGEYDTRAEANKEQKPHQDRQVLKITQHRSFNAKSLYNDLALLEVTEPFSFDYHIKPICIPLISNTYAYDTENCVATGWGKNAFGPDSKHLTTLKKVDLNIVPNDQCQEKLRKTRLGQYFILDPSFVCAGGLPGQDTCEGDGGGPLVCPLKNDRDRYVQVGIVSWGIGCGNDVPAVYASLENNLEWLTEEFNAATVFSSNVDSRKSRN